MWNAGNQSNINTLNRVAATLLLYTLPGILFALYSDWLLRHYSENFTLMEKFGNSSFTGTWFGPKPYLYLAIGVILGLLIFVVHWRSHPRPYLSHHHPPFRPRDHPPPGSASNHHRLCTRPRPGPPRQSRSLFNQIVSALFFLVEFLGSSRALIPRYKQINRP
jgi:hypothetical protein